MATLFTVKLCIKFYISVGKTRSNYVSRDSLIRIFSAQKYFLKSLLPHSATHESCIVRKKTPFLKMKTT